MRRLTFTLLLLPILVFALDLEGLKEFFNRQGYVVKVDKDKVVVDLGKGKLFPGEELLVLREGQKIVHPVTGKVLGVEQNPIGRIKITTVEESYSVGRLVEGKDVKPSDRVKVYVPDVCYAGSDEGYFQVSSAVEGVKRGQGCPYVVKEFSDGFGVEFNQKPVAFFPKPSLQTTGLQRASLEDLSFLGRSKLIRVLPSLPLSADVGDVYGNGKDYLVVLYSSKLEVYEILKNDLLLRSSYSLPAGIPVSVSVGRIGEENKDYILVNMVSGDKASSLILKMVGDMLVSVKKDIPMFMAVLDKSRPTETFVGQTFDFSNKFGKTVRLKLEGDKLVEAGPFAAPRGFRIDSAFYFGKYLVFTDSNQRVRVFDGEQEVYSTDEGFGGSYTSVEIPILDQGKTNYIFSPKGTTVDIVGFKAALVIKNTGGVIQRFLDILKYTRGELFLLGEKRQGVLMLKQIRGGSFEESIQAIVSTKDGKVYVLTGKKGTIPIQNRGEVYELELRLL
ncbi:hypothetical protein [Thermocrinis minervae]|uniref:Uncharacterized protein n=1 Tax=Thermocrinis minervae TaxID=381751 RepID=A0A1M6QJH9_9AQUI|nr:hypothetical protein [Thermocrinis minervae]SHK20392.1 hypothetical protein SAMN05444391_0263 [Thermocrinis minervae]